MQVPDGLAGVVDWDVLDPALKEDVSKVLGGGTEFGRVIQPFLKDRVKDIEGRRYQDILRDNDLMDGIAGIFGEHDPVGLTLAPQDKAFMTSTEVGRAFKFAGVYKIKSFFRDKDITFEDLVKLGLKPSAKKLFDEFRDTPGFQRLLHVNLNLVLNFAEPWEDLTTELGIAKSMKDVGFSILQFEGRETGLRMDEKVKTASVNPDMIVERDGDKYLVEMKKTGNADTLYQFFHYASHAYPQAKRYVKAVEQRDYKGVIIAFSNPRSNDRYPPEQLTPIRDRVERTQVVYAYNARIEY